uniref:hypothetical protein n=1 Tax=Thomasclavelia cocleata TaxID=69824 RepID=UPI00256F3EFF
MTKFSRNAIICSIICIIISLLVISWIKSSTSIVDGEVIYFEKQHKNDFIMSDTYNNKDCIFSYEFNSQKMSGKISMNANNLKIGDTYKLIVDKNGSIFNLGFVYTIIFVFAFGLFLFGFSVYNYL